MVMIIMMVNYDEHNDEQGDADDNLPWLANAQEGGNGSDEREAQTPG